MKLIITELENIIVKYWPLLQNLNQEYASIKPSPLKWSKKEIIGHMVDSAQNNIRRFVVAQYEEKPFIKYSQDRWVIAANYQDYPLIDLVRLWILLNNHIVRILKNLPENLWQSQVDTGNLRTIEWLTADYNKHLLHHLHQALDMDPVPYP